MNLIGELVVLEERFGNLIGIVLAKTESRATFDQRWIIEWRSDSGLHGAEGSWCTDWPTSAVLEGIARCKERLAKKDEK